MLIPTAAHCRSTAAIHSAIAAVQSTVGVKTSGVTSAILHDVRKTFAGTRPHARGYGVENNANHRGGSRRCAAVAGASSPQGHDVGLCRGPAAEGGLWSHLVPGRATPPSSNGSFPPHCCPRRTQEQPPLWAQFVFDVRTRKREKYEHR
jgi:hypothetical protein